MKNLVGTHIHITGIVQGVGFRPFIYKIATQTGLYGWVRNTSSGVDIQIDSTEENLRIFLDRIEKEFPPLARIDSMQIKRVDANSFSTFEIKHSKPIPGAFIPISPDVSICDDCLRELLDPNDPRYRYPFINCTNCGPRFTIIEDIPYDRPNTTMAPFELCDYCKSQYENPLDRRFHAQPVACENCGPYVWFERIDIKENQKDFEHSITNDDAIIETQKSLSQGKILAIKGLGGFHLACDATNEDAVMELRSRKLRVDKPFALMMANIETIEDNCIINQKERDLLLSRQHPIVLVKRKNTSKISKSVAPYQDKLGVMLPYTPLHQLLMSGPDDVLILTSANASGLPIIKDDDEAITNLKGIADYYLTHNRHIVQRCDDSVVSLNTGDIQMHRRSRGFTPSSVVLKFSSEATILGAGSELKNTFCFLKGNEAFLSQHLGEIDTVEAETAYLESLQHIKKLLNTDIDAVGFDLHPTYNISSLAKSVSADRHYGIYHHHAHFASCLAENAFKNKAIGVILDGTGYGDDGLIWGFEILTGDFSFFKREFHQSYLPLPGGDVSGRSPWRVATSYLHQAMGPEGLIVAKELFGNRFMDEIPIVSLQLEKRINTVMTSSCGRLFDAVAAILGICQINTYDGQAAIELSELLTSQNLIQDDDYYPFTITDKEVNLLQIFPALLHHFKNGCHVKYIARRFHNTLALAICDAVHIVSERTGLDTVALSGGTWLNPYLLKKTVQLIKDKNLNVLLHRKVPPNDGGISLGQAAITSWRWKNDVPGFTNAFTGNRK